MKKIAVQSGTATAKLQQLVEQMKTIADSFRDRTLVFSKVETPGKGSLVSARNRSGEDPSLLN